MTAPGRPARGVGEGSRRWRGLALVALAGVLLGSPSDPAAATDHREPPDAPLVEGVVAGWPSAPEVTAEAWVLVEASTGQVLGERRGQERRPVASTIKILTALTVLDRTDPDEVVTVGDEVEVGGASVGLSPGDQWTVEQLLSGLIARSGNDAAQALAVHVGGDQEGFVELMVADAAALGLSDVVLTEATGLEDGNDLSARDLASLARVALADEDLRPLLGRERVELPGVGAVRSRNELLGDYPGATGVKTGYTQAAGYSLVASARRDGRELIAVLLASDEDPARFRDAARLLDHGFADYEAVSVGGTWRLAVGGGQRELAVTEESATVPAGAEVDVAGLPPVSARPGPIELEMVVDERSVADLQGEVVAEPGSRAGTAGLGRALAGQVHAGLRAATAVDAW